MGWTKTTRKAYTVKNREQLNAAARTWRAKNLEKTRAWHRDYYAKNRDKKLASSKAWREANPDKKAASDRRTRGLPVPTRPEPQVCESCGRAPSKRSLNLDHCHITGAFRGWLCMQCNTGIGKLGDDLSGVLRAADYLRRNQSDT